MSETRNVSYRLATVLREGGLDGIRIEGARVGTPDVNYRGGWVECKYLSRWPVHADTRPVKFSHPWTKGQQVWARRRSRAGGTVILCAKVGQRDWFFWEYYDELRKLFGAMTRPDMVQTAALHLPAGMNKVRVIEWIQAISKG